MSVIALISGVIEKFTGFLSTISSDHNYIHAGKGFSLINTATINDGVTLKFSFTTPNVQADSKKKYIHWRPAGISSSAAGVGYRLYEGSTSVSGGTVVTPLNRNRNSLKISQITNFSQGATATEGTLVQSANFGTGGIPARASGGAVSGNDEWVLKSNTIYTISLINLGGANSSVTWDFFWYEEDKA